MEGGCNEVITGLSKASDLLFVNCRSSHLFDVTGGTGWALLMAW